MFRIDSDGYFLMYFFIYAQAYTEHLPLFSCLIGSSDEREEKSFCSLQSVTSTFLLFFTFPF